MKNEMKGMGLHHLVPTTGQGRDAAHNLQAHELRSENVRRKAEDRTKRIQCIMPGLDGGKDGFRFLR